jgi:hypothetical protein
MGAGLLHVGLCEVCVGVPTAAWISRTCINNVAGRSAIANALA